MDQRTRGAAQGGGVSGAQLGEADRDALGGGAAAVAGKAGARSPAGAAHSMGEAIGAGAGRSDVGKGAPPDRGDAG